MQTEAVFENIAVRIQKEISKAQKSVFIAVERFTDEDIFNELVNKAVSGCTVSLIISNDSINSTIDFERLTINKSKVYKIGKEETELIHNKFCVIDNCTTITGSYNWGFKSESNFENVVITSNDTTLAGQFIAKFNKILNFIAKNQQLSVWTYPEIVALKLELKNLQNHLNAYDNEKIELEKLMSEFQHRHAIELGELILEILKLRKLKFRLDQSKYKDAENDERQYREQIQTEQEKEIFEITSEQKTELKKKFRKATVMCHPDKVSDKFKEAAQTIFIELKQAYDANDLKKVTSILDDLEKGNYFKTMVETVSKKDLLKAAIAKLGRQIKTLETEIIAIKKSDTFKTINSIDNWDDYFSHTKEKLIIELQALKLESTSKI